MTILDQKGKYECIPSTWLAYMEILGLVNNPQEILEQCPDNILSDREAEQYFQSLGYKVKSEKVKPIQFKGLLNRGIPIAVGINGYDKESMKKPPYICKFRANSYVSHRVLLIPDKELLAKGLLRVQNSWGENWGDKGYFYIRVEDTKGARIFHNPITICNLSSKK